MPMPGSMMDQIVVSTALRKKLGPMASPLMNGRRTTDTTLPIVPSMRMKQTASLVLNGKSACLRTKIGRMASAQSVAALIMPEVRLIPNKSWLDKHCPSSWFCRYCEGFPQRNRTMKNLGAIS